MLRWQLLIFRGTCFPLSHTRESHLQESVPCSRDHVFRAQLSKINSLCRRERQSLKSYLSSQRGMSPISPTWILTLVKSMSHRAGSKVSQFPEQASRFLLHRFAIKILFNCRIWVVR